MSDLESDWIKFGVYGESGRGKTTLACTFPKPLLIVSSEPTPTGGALSVRKVPDVFVRFLKTPKDVDAAVNDIQSHNRYATVVLDSVTSLQDLYLRDILGLEKLPEQGSWGGITDTQYRVRSERTREGIRPFIDLDCHTVVIGKEKDHNPPKEEKVNPNTGKKAPDMRPKFLRGMQPASFFSFDVGGATAGWLFDKLDFVCRMYVADEVVTSTETIKALGRETTREVERETGRRVRRLWTDPTHPNYAARFRTDSPETMPPYVEQPTPEEVKGGVTWYDKILKVIEGR